MISPRLPSRMITPDRTDIRLLGQKHNRRQAPQQSTTERNHRADSSTTCGRPDRRLCGAVALGCPAGLGGVGWTVMALLCLRLSRPARGGGSRAVAQAGTARVLFRSHDAPRHARNPDLAVLLEHAHFRDGVCPDPLLRRYADLLQRRNCERDVLADHLPVLL